MAGMSGVAGNVAMTGCIGGIIKSWTANFTRATTDNTIAFLALIDSVTLGVAVDGEATFSCNYAIASTATAYTSAVTTSVWA